MTATEKVRAHALKTWPDPFQAVWDGRKRFEWRKNDRDFATGDLLGLREWDHDHYTGRWILARITYRLCPPAFDLPDGYCVLSIDPLGYGVSGEPPMEAP